MNNFYTNFGTGLGVPTGLLAHGALLILALLLWSMFWKGLALWHSARKGQPWWFVILVIFNTAGILEIVYLFAVIKLKFSELFSKK